MHYLTAATGCRFPPPVETAQRPIPHTALVIPPSHVCLVNTVFINGCFMCVMLYKLRLSQIYKLPQTLSTLNYKRCHVRRVFDVSPPWYEASFVLIKALVQTAARNLTRFISLCWQADLFVFPYSSQDRYVYLICPNRSPPLHKSSRALKPKMNVLIIYYVFVYIWTYVYIQRVIQKSIAPHSKKRFGLLKDFFIFQHNFL